MNAETKLNTLYRIGSRVSLNKEQAKEFEAVVTDLKS